MTQTANSTAQTPAVRRIIVAITGASGAIYGVRLLQILQSLRESAGVESHLLMSPAGLMNVQHELHMAREEVEALAHVVHNVRDIGATIASGSFAAQGQLWAANDAPILVPTPANATAGALSYSQRVKIHCTSDCYQYVATAANDSANASASTSPPQLLEVASSSRPSTKPVATYW